MRIFITGIAGFLGSHLAERMLALGHEVYGNDNEVCGTWANIPNGVHPFDIDCCDTERLGKLFSNPYIKPDVLYHCAATAHEGFSVFSPSFITRNIFEASVSVFSAAIAAGVKRIVFMSSMARYGKGAMRDLGWYGPPFKENFPTAPQDPYGIAKVAAEQVLKCLCEVHGVEYVIAVPHNIVGVRQKYDDPYRNVASIMANRMLSGKQPIVYGDGLQRRCFSPIDDVIDILGRLAVEPGISGEIFNIGPDGEGITINELAAMLADIIGFGPLDPIYMPDRPQEVKVALCSSDKIRERFGYKPIKPLRECLEEMVAAIQPKPFDYSFPQEIINDKMPRAWKERLM